MLKVKIALNETAAPAPAAVKAAATDYQRRFAEGRKAAKITLQDLASAIELSPQAVSQFELGKSSISLANFLRACQALGLRTDWVLTGQGKMWEAGTPAVASKRPRAAARKLSAAAPQ